MNEITLEKYQELYDQICVSDMSVEEKEKAIKELKKKYLALEVDSNAVGVNGDIAIGET